MPSMRGISLALQGLAIDLAHYGRVIDDQYFDLVGHVSVGSW
jgi:hypothetical protein